MLLAQKGTEVLEYESEKKLDLRTKLIDGDVTIFDYIKGVCYDAVAFVLYLRGVRISNKLLMDLTGEEWIDIFSFEEEWNGISSLPEGHAVGFYRVHDNKYFHAGLSIGGTKIRGINGFRLGQGWLEPVDLRTVLTERDAAGTFKYDGTEIRVYLSSEKA